MVLLASMKWLKILGCALLLLLVLVLSFFSSAEFKYEANEGAVLASREEAVGTTITTLST